MPRATRHRAFLVTVVQMHQPRRTYAVVKQTPEKALAAVRDPAAERARVYLVGGLPWNMVRRMEMKPGDVRLLDTGTHVAGPLPRTLEGLPSTTNPVDG